MLLTSTAAGCVPQPVAGTLAPTLSIRPFGGDNVAMQDGIPVPTFDPQTRPTLDLSGLWRVERAQFDSELTLTDRGDSLSRIEAAAGGRQLVAYDDSRWASLRVPGSVNPPPDHAGGSAWYRRHFDLPPTWTNRVLTLKFGAANYVADVWLNGHYLGYHEGGFTPFAFDATPFAIDGGSNVLAVRVDDPEWGSRDDIVPWGLADWWNYGGLTQRVWLEATSPLLVARADVVPHLDGADVTVTVEHRKAATAPAGDRFDAVVEILPATIRPATLLDLNPHSLLLPDERVLARKEFDDVSLGQGSVSVLRASFEMSGAAVWSIGHPDLYVLRVTLSPAAPEPQATPSPTFDARPAAEPAAAAPAPALDQLLTSFGIRHVAVDPDGPRIVLNGAAVTFKGVSVHDEATATTVPAGGPYAGPLTTTAAAYAQLQRATQVNATLVRTAHQPGVPDTLMLADRLGVAVWEEIPLYHFTPRTFQLTLSRGIPQQMLREMALRDMNRPSVLFYGLSNESTGDAERTTAMATLQKVAKEIDGTRLTGQASFGFNPSDGTSDPLDVAGFTFYYGVFYGSDAAEGTRAALAAAHARYPSKPLMILEFGRWADPPDGPRLQQQILSATEGELETKSTLWGGYVAGDVWWSLDDYYTMRPGISLERFGLFDAAGSPRPAARVATAMFEPARVDAAVDRQPATTSAIQGQVVRPVENSGSTLRLAGYLLYGLAVTVAGLAAMLGVSLAFNRLRERRGSS